MPMGSMFLNQITKVVLIVLGFIALGLGILGIILPILPTTPLLLLAAFCFMKGSEKFDRWFKGTKIYKKHLEAFVREKAMTLKQKVTLSLFSDFMIAIPLFTVDRWIVKFILILIIVYKYYYFIFKIKTKK
jgi:uncharacterized protein